MNRNPSATIKEFFRKPVSVDQAKDTIAMTWPKLYKPVARIWLGLSRLLGTFMSRVVLSLLFIGLVVPVGLFRRLLGRDPLRLTEWKKGKGSVLRSRSETFRREKLPLIVTLLLFGGLIVFTSGSAIAPFIYTLF